MDWKKGGGATWISPISSLVGKGYGEMKSKAGEKLHFRHIGSGFITAPSIEGLPPGRKLAKTYADQYNRTYVMINDRLEPVSACHGYIGAE